MLPLCCSCISCYFFQGSSKADGWFIPLWLYHTGMRWKVSKFSIHDWSVGTLSFLKAEHWLFLGVLGLLVWEVAKQRRYLVPYKICKQSYTKNKQYFTFTGMVMSICIYVASIIAAESFYSLVQVSCLVFPHLSFQKGNKKSWTVMCIRHVVRIGSIYSYSFSVTVYQSLWIFFKSTTNHFKQDHPGNDRCSYRYFWTLEYISKLQ